MLSLNKSFVSIIVVLCFVNGGFLKVIPKYIQICKLDSTFDECVLKSIEALRPQLKAGIPELNVPSIEPFIIPHVDISEGGSVPIKATGKNIAVTGASDFTIKSLAVDLSVPDVVTIRAKVKIPNLHLEGKYKVDAKILVVPINGEGTMKADAVKATADIVLHGVVQEKKGVRSLFFTGLDTDIKVKDYKIALDGLFNGDKALGQATNEALNQNRDEFFKAVKPALENAVSKMFLEAANKITDELPYEELFLKA